MVALEGVRLGLPAECKLSQGVHNLRAGTTFFVGQSPGVLFPVRNIRTVGSVGFTKQDKGPAVSHVDGSVHRMIIAIEGAVKL